MITSLSDSPYDTHTHTLSLTYPRPVNISFGNYPYADHIENLKIEIKNNIRKDLTNASHVKGNMTDWFHFMKNSFATKFINYCINKHQLTNPELFAYFYEKMNIINIWGNELKKGHYIGPHQHSCFHGILYLTEGSPLIIPDLKIKIIPKPGDYYFFPPIIWHYVDPQEADTTPYNIVFNISPRIDEKFWEKNKYVFNKKNENEEKNKK